jgi:hypothetical protein
VDVDYDSDELSDNDNIDYPDGDEIDPELLGKDDEEVDDN